MTKQQNTVFLQSLLFLLLSFILITAAKIGILPGRKTDVRDAECIADLLQHGLLQTGFISNKAQRELGKLVSYRKSLIGDRTGENNFFKKCLKMHILKYPAR